MTGSPLKWQPKNQRSGLIDEFGAKEAFAVRPALLGDLRDAVEHQHRGQRQLGVSGPEQLAAAAGEQILEFKAGASFAHYPSLPRACARVSGRSAPLRHTTCARVCAAQSAGF